MYDPLGHHRLSIKEIEEALGGTNAYYFFVQHGRSADGPMELIRHYALNQRIRIIGYDVEPSYLGNESERL